MITALLDHLWQSTLFAMAALMLTLALRRNGARVRFWVWFAASMKFLLPFSALVALGEGLARLLPVPVTVTPQLLAVRSAAEALSAPTGMAAPTVLRDAVLPGAQLMALVPPVLLAAWALGFAILLAVRLVRWCQLQALLRGAAALDLNMDSAVPVPVKASASLLEPGLVGIRKPVILLPQGMLEKLTHQERDAILAHELSHLRRRDNLTAALHMLVEVLFWFYPPVWLIGARMIAERERACDEQVCARGHDPEIYATGILKVCKFYLQTPLACAAGATGADLTRRLHWIMADRPASALGPFQKLALGSLLLLTLALPLSAGMVETAIGQMPIAVQVRQTVAVLQSRLAVDRAAVEALASQGAALIAPHAAPRPEPVPAPRRARYLAPVEIDTGGPAVPPLPGTPVTAPVAAQAAPVMPETRNAVAEMRPASAPLTSAPLGGIMRVSVPRLVLSPDGKGDPDAVTCRVPQQLPGSRLVGPQVCKTNRVWATLKTTKAVISPDGQSLLATNRPVRGSASCTVDIRFGSIIPTSGCF